tara:strand:+ start:820 stop:1647 length:828 start_codon:yes stop_codon:yes gene_type:complete
MKLNIPQFKDKKELYKYLVANKEELITLKETAANKNADATVFEPSSEVVKALSGNVLPKDNPSEGVIYRTVIANTYNWLDSHDDVHVKGIFTKSIQENKAKIRHTHDHVQMLTAKVANVLDVYEKEVLWKDLGINKEGSTICLLADAAIKANYNQQIFDAYKDGEIDQHSVEMIYQKMQLAINDPEEKTEYKAWQAVYPLLGNPEKALEQGYFFVQSTSKLKAYSCVVEGSNSLTGTLEPSNKDTLLDNEPSIKDTQKEETQKRNETDYSKIKFI